MVSKLEEKESYIRVHTSDTATFKRCRRRWDWTSPNRGNLRPKVQSQGINFNLAFGSIVHRALEKYYAGVYDINVAERQFTEDWQRLTERVQELNEGFYLENHEEFERHAQLGVGMLQHYAYVYNTELEQFEVVDTEHDFAVDTGLRARNPETGELVRVMYCGRQDLIIRDKRTGKYGVMDHKTSSRHDDEDYLVKLDMDEQVTRYMWAAELEAQQQDKPYTKIDYVLYNILFKAYPKPPSITEKGGWPSLNRQTESTTAEMFMDTVRSKPEYTEWYRNSEKAQSYLQYLFDEGSNRFLRRELVTRNSAELRACGERVLAECQDMLAADLRIYPNATGEWYCIKCPFRGPCLAANDGSDVGYILETNYEANMDEAGNYTLGV